MFHPTWEPHIRTHRAVSGGRGRCSAPSEPGAALNTGKVLCGREGPSAFDIGVREECSRNTREVFEEPTPYTLSNTGANITTGYYCNRVGGVPYGEENNGRANWDY